MILKLTEPIQELILRHFEPIQFNDNILQVSKYIRQLIQSDLYVTLHIKNRRLNNILNFLNNIQFNITDILISSNYITRSVEETNNIINILEKFTNLSKLNLFFNNISNINNLAKFTNLIELDLNSNTISNIDSLANLTNLTKLKLHTNNISNIDSLANLTNLKELYINDNSISNIDQLAILTNLKELYINDNNISNIDSLVNLINHVYLVW